MSDSGDGALDEVTRMYKVRHTVLSMLVDRGYHIANEQLDMTKEDFVANFVQEQESGTLAVQRAKMYIQARKQDDPMQAIMVFFCPDLKMAVATLKAYEAEMKTRNASRGIVVLRDKCSPQCRTAIREAEEHHTVIELFKEMELVVDITKHYLVPKHTVLTPEQKAEVLKL